MRGNLKDPKALQTQERSIPACAGEPIYTITAHYSVEVYPRVCGGTSVYCSGNLGGRGLSPRVRGNPGRRQRAVRAIGSIPACAGEPYFQTDAARLVEVYPRVCGGTGYTLFGASVIHGLSPRVRGNLLITLSSEPSVRSIPACAGEPCRAIRGACGGRVYPRVCGGTGNGILTAEGQEGLSPRVRGNLDLHANGAAAQGSIPACAGEPCP